MYDVMFADAIQAYGGGELTVTGPTATAGIFATYPADYLSAWGGVMDQVRYYHSRYCLHVLQRYITTGLKTRKLCLCSFW